MKPRYIALVCILIASLASIHAPLAESEGAACYRAERAYLVGNMNIRAGATTDTRVAARARAGDVFTVTSSRRGATWCWLEVTGGWMAKTSRVRSTEPAQPVIPVSSQPAASQPTNINNCCFVDRQCQTDKEWTDGYWAYQNNQCGGQRQTSTPASASGSQVNNCCFIGWQCHTDDDWLRGYSAYQSNQCQNAQMQAALSVAIPPGVDNCCRVNQDCRSDADWNRGWLAFQHFRCNLPAPSDGISIQGSPEFITQVTNALRLLRDRAPKWWKYATSGLNAMKMIPEGGLSGVYPHSKVYEETLSEVLKDGRGEAGLVYVIFGIVHEACHIHEDHRYADGLDEEKACMEASLYALQEINPADRSTIDWIKWIIANIHKPDVQWW